MMSDKRKSALQVQSGIEPPPSVNEDAARKFIQRRGKKPSVRMLAEGIIGGDRTTLGRAITLVESKLESDQDIAQELINECLPFAGHSKRIGITGVPGVGKSSFIEILGKHITSSGEKLAVLAIDPSSSRSGGSILGDKTRMEELANNPLAFIRPSPSAGSLGGVARKTRETLILCEAAGYRVILIETVGVGQSEIAVHSMVDFFLLLMLAGAGDELQGIKRGIMEMADMIAITKADGDNVMASDRARAEYQQALHLFPPQSNGWIPEVLTVSAHNNVGIAQLWEKINAFFEMTQNNGALEKQRKEQSLTRMHESIRSQLTDRFNQNPDILKHITEIEEKVLNGSMSSYHGANLLLNIFWKSKSNC